MKALILGALALAVLFSQAAEARRYGYHYRAHHASQGGHYVGGKGSSHRGGHYINGRTHNHYHHHTH